MLRYLFAALSIGISAITVPAMLKDNPDLARDAAVIARDQVRVQVARTQTQQPQEVRLSGTETIRQDRSGHYIAQFRLNNERVMGMIDTGASMIAINQTTARRAGLTLSNDDFVYAVSTANGQTRAARAILDQVEIGSIRIRKVEVMVLDDAALDGVLIGMSFMNRLKSFEQSRGQLVLRQ
jgi:aspartyl protease family protein